jgi:hypothetical protein
MIAYSEGIKNAWPKQGFEHYFLMSNVIFGAVALTLFVSYVAIIILKKKKPNWYILLPVLVIFLLNCAMNAQSFNFGPGNGGNLRYLIIISPLLGILGVLGLDEIIQFNKKYLLLIFLIPLLIAVGAFQTFDHNFIKLIEVVNWKPLIFSIIITVLLILPLKKQHYLISFALISIFLGISTITTRRIQPEEKTIQKAAKWYAQHLKLGNNPQTATTQLFTDTNRIACGHGLFFYYLEKNRRDFIKEPVMKLGIPKETADTFQVGDLIIWESHYGYRPKLSPTSQPYDFYDKNPNFEKIQYYQSIDKRFLVAFFRKIKN